MGDEGHLAGGANGDELVTPGKRFGSSDSTVFGKLDESGCSRVEVMPR